MQVYGSGIGEYSIRPYFGYILRFVGQKIDISIKTHISPMTEHTGDVSGPFINLPNSLDACVSMSQEEIMNPLRNAD